MISPIKRLSGLAAILVLLCACNSTAYIQFGGYAQGGTYSIKCNAKASMAPELQKDIDGILTSIDTILSGYNKKSVLSRLNAGERVVLPQMLADVYSLSYELWQESAGAFDVSCGPLFDAWGFGFKGKGEMPDNQRVAELKQSCGMQRLVSPSRMQELVGTEVCASDLLLEDGPAPILNFNAIAQGFSCDTVASYLRSRGVKDMLVDIGEIYCQGLNPAGKGWTIAIDNPVDGNDTPGADIRGTWCSDGRSCGVVTSGNYRKFYIKDGQKFAHTIDPRSGFPVQHNLLSATVVAETGARADALATFFMVIGRDDAALWLAEHPDTEACLISSTGSEWYSQGRLQQGGE